MAMDGRYDKYAVSRTHIHQEHVEASTTVYVQYAIAASFLSYVDM